MAEPVTLQIVTKQVEPWYISVPIAVGPYVVLAVVAIWAIWYLYPRLQRDLFPRIGKISGYGLEIQLMATNVATVYAKKKQVMPSGPLVAGAIDRLVRARERIRGKSIVWVDAHPTNNTAEVELLKRLEVKVDQVETPSSGLIKIEALSPSIVISSWGDANEGNTLAQSVSQLEKHPPTIIYTSNMHVGEPRQRPVFGLTDQPAELFHLIVDAIEREVT